MSKKIKLSLSDIYSLEIEISGASNPENGNLMIKGLMNQKLSLVTKFKLSEIKEVVSVHKKNVDSLREELIKKLGDETKDGGFSLSPMIVKLDKKGKEVKDEKGNPTMEINPKFLEFNSEMEKLLKEEREISIPDLSIEDFNIETDEVYTVFFKLLTPSPAVDSVTP